MIAGAAVGCTRQFDATLPMLPVAHEELAHASCLFRRVGFADNPVVANCDNCGAPLRIDRDRGHFVCDYCLSQQEVRAATDYVELLSETSSLCPICSTPLSASRLEGHPLLSCARCFGMLIAMNRFAALIDAVRGREERSRRIALPRRQNPADRLINCPACGQPMLSHIYAGPGNAVIDSCERCQVNWLDPGELRRIAVAPDS
jgi:Zn-finger nucleic acid-binding protein